MNSTTEQFSRNIETVKIMGSLKLALVLYTFKSCIINLITISQTYHYRLVDDSVGLSNFKSLGVYQEPLQSKHGGEVLYRPDLSSL